MAVEQIRQNPKLAPRRHKKIRMTRELIAFMLEIPDDVRIERLIPTYDSGGFDVLLSSDRFAPVEEEAEAPIEMGLMADRVEHEGKVFVRYWLEV